MTPDTLLKNLSESLFDTASENTTAERQDIEGTIGGGFGVSNDN
jgi:hypothetical protein